MDIENDWYPGYLRPSIVSVGHVFSNVVNQEQGSTIVKG
jgi:hypothetical protein